jgi:predicted NBD/HSP70 family sugar kinase
MAAIPPLLKDLNERAVLETVRNHAPISRAQISRQARISKPTVSVALQSLLDAGLVRESRDDPDGPSYGATFFEPVHEAALVLGFDLGARFLRGAVCDLDGRIRARQDVETPNADAAVIAAALVDLRDALVATSGLAGGLVDRVVVGVPGAVDRTSRDVRLTNVPGLEGAAFADDLERRLGLPVALENDIDLAALGEQWLGVARGVEDFAFMSIGTGLGAGIVLRGELVRGRHGTAGELDYAHAGLDSDVDPCAAAVSAYTERLVGESVEPHALAPPYDARATFGAARAGDELAKQVVAEVSRRIALNIVPVAAVADVELVVLGGGLGSNGDLLLEPVRELLARWVPYPPRVEVSALSEAAVLTGALSVGLRDALENVFVNRRAPTALA